MLVKSKTLAMLICVATLAGCFRWVAPSDALYGDVAPCPPRATQATVSALVADRPVGEFVALHGRLSEAHGCVE